jgi:hypothetical protein
MFLTRILNYRNLKSFIFKFLTLTPLFIIENTFKKHLITIVQVLINKYTQNVIIWSKSFQKFFGILNHIFVKMKIRIQKHGKNYKKEGKYSYYEVEGTPLVILHGLMGG